MSTVDDLDEVIERCQTALGEFVKGNPEPTQMMFSHREDVTRANPIAPPARGWEQVAATMERAASNLREGEITGFETVANYVTPELAYVVWIERSRGKIGGRQDTVSFPLRVTTIFSTRRRHLEDRPSARRHGNHPSAGRIANTGIEPS